MIEEGVSQVSARALAKRIGYSPGTLYNLFDNIDAVVYQVNADTLRDLAAAAMAAVGERSEPLDRAIALGRALPYQGKVFTLVYAAGLGVVSGLATWLLDLPPPRLAR